MLQWYQRYQHKYPEIADLARRPLSTQASSATSERAFSKVGIVISKKRQRLTANHVDGISLLEWHYEDNGLGRIIKETLVCFHRWKDKGLEEESKMAAQ